MLDLEARWILDPDIDETLPSMACDPTSPGGVGVADIWENTFDACEDTPTTNGELASSGVGAGASTPWVIAVALVSDSHCCTAVRNEWRRSPGRFDNRVTEEDPLEIVECKLPAR